MSAFAFFSALTNKVILCVQTSGVSLVSSEKIFLAEGLFSVFRKSPLSLDSPTSTKMFVADDDARILFLAGNTNYSSAPRLPRLCAHSNAGAGAAGL